ncbi:GDSL-type esterase/lipase family protein [Streptomyces sp. NPDC008137]|uniref:SGNH/GDSL hydrolase family protein n=1 Tax=Streptomyces sp. NPDC008137 TaxID=3364813 RepID=UPI0036E5570C
MTRTFWNAPTVSRGAAALAAATSLIAVAGVAVPASADTAPLEYVAMGDSYSSGAGNLPLDLTAPPSCWRSTVNYANVITRATGASLTDVTCSGATTANFATSQGPGIAPQLDAVTSTTRLVTMTIGGNDNNVFANVMNGCAIASATTLGQGTPCEQQYGTSFVDTINSTTYPAIIQALKAVKAKAPHARVAILGYPWIAPAAGGCYPTLPIAVGDIPYVRGIQATMNDTVRRAAGAAGAIYVDMSGPSNGHDACEAPGVRWVEPLVTTTSLAVGHPNALGESEMAAQVRRVLHLP